MLSDGKKTSTATRRVAAVAYMHRALSLKSPVTREVRQLIHGAKRMRTEQVRRMRPLQLADVRAIAISLAAEGTPIAIRNRAIILTGFVSALRSANLAALHVNDVEFCEPGCLLRINREKNDQEGRGRMIGLPKGSAIETCPVGALADWMERRGGFPGPLFTRFASTGALQALPLVPERIGLVVKQCAQRIGLDPQFYSGHSLRSGFVTTAGEGGATDLLIAHQTGHRDMNVLRRYFRKQDCFRGAVSMLGV